MPGYPPIAAGLAVTECAVWLHFPRWTMAPESPVYSLRGLLGEALIALLHPDLAKGADPPVESPFWPMFKPSVRDPKVQRPCFLMDCPQGAGGALSLSARLRLFGRGRDYLGVLIEALKGAGRLGFGVGERTPFEIEAGEAVAVTPPWQGDGEARAGDRLRFALEFTAPAQLSVKLDAPVGKVALQELLGLTVARLHGAEYGPFDLVPYAAAVSAVRGLEGLAAAYGDGARLVDGWSARVIEGTRLLRYSLWPEEDVQFSGRKKVDLGGVMGRVEVEGPRELFHILRCGELIGVGMHTGFGCGRIRVAEL